MSTPFTSTSYTNELIQDQQAQSVADVLLNDPSVRSARGFGNFPSHRNSSNVWKCCAARTPS
ncbi:Ferrichrome receptor FcuA precursor [Mycobacteroides abscessus subsp. abscessus]|nr:Ferrichrome receptor FcuA precursor [Mycobacteroides abscessus subsp. abscessus]